MYDGDGVRILTDAELNSDSAKRLQDIERRLVQISKKLTWVATALWVLVIIAVWHFR